MPVLRVVLFLTLAAALIPLAAFFVAPFTYTLLLLALTFAFDRRAHVTLGLLRVPLVLPGLAAGMAIFLIQLLAMKAIFGGTLEVKFAWLALAMMVSSVITEELLFRGYAFQTLAGARGVRVAMAVFAIVVGMYHWMQWNLWSQPLMMLLVLVSTGLAHVFFALAFLRGGTLWLPIGLHLGWNASDQALDLAGLPRTTATFLVNYAISLLLLLIAVAVLYRVTAPRARPLPAT